MIQAGKHMNPLQLIIIALTLLPLNSQAAETTELKGEVLYSQVNMYSLKGKIVSWANYKVDTLIPVNTAVIIKPDTGNKVFFAIKGTDIRLVLKNKTYKSKLSGKGWLAKHFAKTKVPLEKFTLLEREGIKSASIKIGMSKAAILVARGFPPAHLTPELEATNWIYLTNKWDKEKVLFINGRVSQVITNK